jgi:hypothetical protein
VVAQVDLGEGSEDDIRLAADAVATIKYPATLAGLDLQLAQESTPRHASRRDASSSTSRRLCLKEQLSSWWQTTKATVSQTRSVALYTRRSQRPGNPLKRVAYGQRLKSSPSFASAIDLAGRPGRHGVYEDTSWARN